MQVVLCRKLPCNKCWGNARLALDHHHFAIPTGITDSSKHQQLMLRPLAKGFEEEDIPPEAKWCPTDYLQTAKIRSGDNYFNKWSNIAYE